MGQFEVTWAGFGGQGIMVAGQLLAYAGIAEGKNVVWIPSYGPEMRGGTAYCTVVVSDQRIGSPIINSPTCCVVFNRPSFDKFEPRIRPDGFLLVNSSLIDVSSERDDLTELLVPANDLAMKAGSAKSTNIAMVGAFIGLTDVVKFETMKNTIAEKLARKKEFMKINMAVLEQSYELGKKAAKGKKKAKKGGAR